VRKMFVVSSAADESVAMDAAYATSQQLQPERLLQPLRDLYLGRAYSETEILDCFLAIGPFLLSKRTTTLT